MYKQLFAASAAAFTFFLAANTLSSVYSIAHAEETTGEKIENKAGDIKTDAKKSHRKAKREMRKAVGTDNAGKDVKDAAGDAGDDISNTAKKTKKKID